MPLPDDTMKGTLPVIAVIGAAVATAMKTTPSRPMALGLSRWTVSSPPVFASGATPSCTAIGWPLFCRPAWVLVRNPEVRMSHAKG